MAEEIEEASAGEQRMRGLVTAMGNPVLSAPNGERLAAAWGGAWRWLPQPVRTAVLVLCVAGGSGAALVTRVLADVGLGREDTVVGVGGGAVTDLAGFAAAKRHRAAIVHEAVDASIDHVRR